MPLWGKNDAASNSTIFAAAQLKVTPNSANRDALFGNSTADAYFTGATVGQYGVDAAEVTAGGGAVAHSGWVLRTVGSGGRAGRVMTEVLVAGGIGTDAEDTVFPDYTILVSSQPVAVSGNASASETKTFGVVAATAPTGGTIGYLWQYSTTNATSGFATTVGNTAFSGQTTATLSVNSATIAVNTWVRSLLSVTGGANVTTSVAKLTVTA